MIEFLENIDRSLFLFINGHYSAAGDFLFYWISFKFTWIPFYIFLLFLAVRILKKNWWLLLVFIPLLILATDQISVHCFKNVFLRYRPCHNLELSGSVHLVNNYCGGMYGFVSSHAANTFGLAMFMWLLFRKHYKGWFWILFVGFAGLISYSRVYLGAHYPADVAVGGLLGISLGSVLFYSFDRFRKKLELR